MKGRRGGRDGGELDDLSSSFPSFRTRLEGVTYDPVIDLIPMKVMRGSHLMTKGLETRRQNRSKGGKRREEKKKSFATQDEPFEQQDRRAAPCSSYPLDPAVRVHSQGRGLSRAYWAKKRT